jgi:hypothetical protein
MIRKSLYNASRLTEADLYEVPRLTPKEAAAAQNYHSLGSSRRTTDRKRPTQEYTDYMNAMRNYSGRTSYGRFDSLFIIDNYEITYSNGLDDVFRWLEGR